MDIWTNGCIDICTIGWIYGLINGVLDGYGLMVGGYMNQWMDIWTNGWICGLMDGYGYEWT